MVKATALEKTLKDLSGSFSITTPFWFVDKIMRKYISDASSFASGDLLDIGCGQKPYKGLFRVRRYIGMDANNNHNPDYVGSAKCMPFAPDSFKTAVCFQVLEHIDDLDMVFSEVHRVLSSKGVFIFTVPFVCRIHGAPYDFWRFSEHGIRYLLEKNNFSVQTIQPMGALLTTQCCLWLFFLWNISNNANGKGVFRRIFSIIYTGSFSMFK
jgi:SAM-dependent methyltransferase